MTLQQARIIVETALTSYCEDSIASDKKAQKQLDKAWQLILEACKQDNDLVI